MRRSGFSNSASLSGLWFPSSSTASPATPSANAFRKRLALAQQGEMGEAFAELGEGEGTRLKPEREVLGERSSRPRPGLVRRDSGRPQGSDCARTTRVGSPARPTLALMAGSLSTRRGFYRSGICRLTHRAPCKSHRRRPYAGHRHLAGPHGRFAFADCQAFVQTLQELRAALSLDPNHKCMTSAKE
jgi:hypothetical protein